MLVEARRARSRSRVPQGVGGGTQPGSQRPQLAAGAGCRNSSPTHAGLFLGGRRMTAPSCSLYLLRSLSRAALHQHVWPTPLALVLARRRPSRDSFGLRLPAHTRLGAVCPGAAASGGRCVAVRQALAHVANRAGATARLTACGRCVGVACAAAKISQPAFQAEHRRASRFFLRASKAPATLRRPDPIHAGRYLSTCLDRGLFCPPSAVLLPVGSQGR